jgi:hypothetical protein
MQKALHFVPGQRINAEVTVESKKTSLKRLSGNFSWVVETDIYNTTYIKCEKDNSKAYLYNNGDLHFFTNYNGAKNTALYWLFMTLFKVPTGFLPNSKSKDSIPLDMMFGGILKFLQDFIAPAFLFLRIDYTLIIKEAGDILSSGDIEMEAIVSKRILGRTTDNFKCDIKVGRERVFEITVDFKGEKIKIECRNELV